MPSFHFGVVGTSFKVAQVSIREEIARKITVEYLEKFSDRFADDLEIVLLSTCNRVETYFASRDIDSVASEIIKLYGLTEIEDSRHTYFLQDNDAVAHLFTVASGIDSLVVGESQIQSQVRDASRIAIQRNICGPYLSKLFHKAYRVGREIRETYPALGKRLGNSVSDSVAHIISEYGKNNFPDTKPNLLLIGLGKMIKLAVNSVEKKQFGSLIVAVRRPEQKIPGTDVISISDLSETIRSRKIDIIVTATSSKDYILTSGTLLPAIKERENGPPLFIIDMSVPRNVDPRIHNECKNVILNNIDDLKNLIPPPTPELSEALRAGMHSIDIRTREFFAWVDENSKVAPVLNSLRKRAEVIRSEELVNALRRLPGLTSEQETVIAKMSERMMRRFLSAPTSNLKAISRQSDRNEISVLTDVLSRIFSLDHNEGEVDHSEEFASKDARSIAHAPEEL